MLTGFAVSKMKTSSKEKKKQPKATTTTDFSATNVVIIDDHDLDVEDKYVKMPDYMICDTW